VEECKGGEVSTGAELQGETLPANESSRGGEGLVRLKITAALAGLGRLGGAVSGVVLTCLGNIISGYPVTPGIGVYAWNVGIMAALGAVFGPPLAWTVLRRVPLWRTLLEPAVAGILASVGVMVFLPEPLFPLLVPAAIFAAAGRLAFIHRERSGVPSSPEPAFGESDLGSVLEDGTDRATE